jgi:hypothetical protein
MSPILEFFWFLVFGRLYSVILADCGGAAGDAGNGGSLSTHGFVELDI